NNIMIIVQLIGGLGNQLFQYATGHSLATQRQDTLKLDISSYTETVADTYKDIRIYGLQHLAITAPIAEKEEISKYFWPYRHKWTRRCWKLRGRLFRRSYTKFSYIEEPLGDARKFDPELQNYTSPNIYLKGFWQSEKYFKDIRAVLLKEFTVTTPANDRNRSLLAEIKEQNSVCLHVRRGNATDPGNPFGALPLDYYQEAVKIISSRTKDPHFFIFSDDPEWTKNNLKIEHPCTYAGNNENQDYEDLRLMSHCKHFINANSTFSWWGAWLSTHPEKIVITPDRYALTKKQTDPDFFPNGWIPLTI
ncbi:MAG: alpha-1,2-fucosyltransferase, partial [Candidatus Vogelbacteria bacterium]|nr:alpha-1,2-fucosyltransferase [Candidatus Vogelbacteria bacterium]